MSWVTVGLAAAGAVKGSMDARSARKQQRKNDAFRKASIMYSPWTGLGDPGFVSAGNTNTGSAMIGGGLQGAMIGAMGKQGGLWGSQAPAGAAAGGAAAAQPASAGAMAAAPKPAVSMPSVPPVGTNTVLAQPQAMNLGQQVNTMGQQVQSPFKWQNLMQGTGIPTGPGGY